MNATKKIAALPFWHERSGRWAMKIGYKHTSSGSRDRAWHYFAGEQSETAPLEVCVEARRLQREWKDIEDQWDTTRPLLEAVESELDWSRPVWFDRRLLAIDLEAAEEIKQAREADAAALTASKVQELQQIAAWGSNPAAMIDALRAAGLLPRGVTVPTKRLTILEAITTYLTDQKNRTGLKFGNKISVGTYNTKRNNLLCCLGLTLTEPPTVRDKILDVSRPLLALDGKDLEAVAEYWFRGDVARRTVKNYFDGLKSFLTWADENPELGFAKPKNTARILAVSEASEPNVTPVNYTLLRTILADTDERTRMSGLLGLTTGYTQADIADLIPSEIQIVGGEMYITRYRSKESGERKLTTRVKMTHWIAPEIAAMMERTKAPQPNPHGRYFLNRYGNPCRQEQPGKGNTNAFEKRWERGPAMKVIDGQRVTFKQLRKWGWNEIQRHACLDVDIRCVGETLAKRWAGQRGSGIGKAYRFEDYTPVIAAQKKWWGEIKSLVI